MLDEHMKILLAILLTVMVGWGTATLAQNSPATAHSAAGDAHPAAADPHPAKADAHPAAPTEIHPSFPGHSSETNFAVGAVAATVPLATTALNATTPTPIENLSIPTFIATPPPAQGTSVTTTNLSTTSTNQTAVTAPVTTSPPPTGTP